MRNECADKVTNFGGAARRRFHAIREKPEGGLIDPPPPPEVGSQITLELMLSVLMF